MERLIHNKMAHHALEMEKYKKHLNFMESELSLMKEQFQKSEAINKLLMNEIEQMKNQFGSQKDPKPQPIVYQDIKVERMLIDKYEMNNNIAQLGVKELGGTLNIGATYGKGIIPEDLAEDFKQNMNQLKTEKQAYQESQENGQDSNKNEEIEINIKDE